MDRADIKEFIREVFGRVQTVDTAKWVSMPCPLAPVTHTHGKDSNPSSGISVKPDGISIFHCFTCHKKGTLPWLLREVGRFTGEDYGELADDIETDELLSGRIPAWGESRLDDDIALISPIDKELYLDLYDPAAGHPYLRRRGISNRAARIAELVVDPDDNGYERILFPVYDRQGQLYGFSGRDTTGKAKLKVKDYHGLPKRHLLLGSHLIQKEDEYVILVEGLMDYARMVTHDLPGLAMMCSDLTEWQVEVLLDIGKPVYMIHDNDEAGLDARDRVGELLCKELPVMKVRYPSECTIETPEGDLRPPEDPAELTKEQVVQMLEDARLM